MCERTRKPLNLPIRVAFLERNWTWWSVRRRKIASKKAKQVGPVGSLEDTLKGRDPPTVDVLEILSNCRGLGKFGGIFPGYVGKIIEFWFFGRACLTTNSKHKLYSYMLKSPITLVEYWHVLAPMPALSKISVNAHTCFFVFLMSRWCYIHMYI